MWGDSGTFDQADGGGGGGFLNNSFASPSGDGTDKKKSKDRRGENVVPVAIRQILQSGEELKIAGIPVHVLTFVGLVRDVDVSSTKITYIVEDTTGQIEVVLFLDNNSEDDRQRQQEQQLLLNTYCRVFGTVRANQGKHYVMSFNIRPVTDLNELTSHLLEVIDVTQSAEDVFKEKDADSAAVAVSMKTNQLNNSMMGIGGSEPMDIMGGPNSRHKVVLGVIEEVAPLEVNGVTVQFIAQHLKGKLNLAQVRESVEHLLQEGFIYTTVDDDHFTVTS